MIVPSVENELSLQLAHQCWFLTGPTASGKTTVGLELARRLNAEIISLDSMAVYRGMNIGTAKPTPQQCQCVPHHLISFLDPTEQFSVSEYLALAQRKIREIREHGREVVFVGGTPLYLKALLRGIFAGPPADWEFRSQVEEEAGTAGLEALHERLMQVDPLSASKLHPHDKRRVIRALEVYTKTGQPISHLQLQFEEGRPAESCKVFALQWPRDVLHRRIDARVEWMFREGFIDEVRGLLDRHGPLSRTAAQAVGYREVIEHLAGQHALPETRELVKTRTRRFARRQETWFRGLRECRFVSQDEHQQPSEIVEQIIRVVAADGP